MNLVGVLGGWDPMTDGYVANKHGDRKFSK